MQHEAEVGGGFGFQSIQIHNMVHCVSYHY